MTNHFEQLVQNARETKLTNEEKSALRQKLVHRFSVAPKPSPLRWFTPAFAFALLVLSVLPWQAEQALPGDFLYSVKEHLNEPIRNITAISEEHDIETNIERAERQYQELELLAIEEGI